MPPPTAPKPCMARCAYVGCITNSIKVICWAKHALILVLPSDALFGEKWLYDYRVLDEFAVLAYWAGDYQACFDACRRLRQEQKIPADYEKGTRENAAFAVAKLCQPALLDWLPKP